jgi:succinate dehydrogenase / fumarate reductase membrane anchor subunit
MSSKSPLGVALGYGVVSGTHHWWMQRVTAVALALLGPWFAISLLLEPSLDYVHARAWLASPVNAVLMLLFVPALIYHSWLGVVVVIEDYVPAKSRKITALLVVQFLHLVLGAAALYGVLKVALGSEA